MRNCKHSKLFPRPVEQKESGHLGSALEEARHAVVAVAAHNRCNARPRLFGREWLRSHIHPDVPTQLLCSIVACNCVISRIGLAKTVNPGLSSSTAQQIKPDTNVMKLDSCRALYFLSIVHAYDSTIRSNSFARLTCCEWFGAPLAECLCVCQPGQTGPHRPEQWWRLKRTCTRL